MNTEQELTKEEKEAAYSAQENAWFHHETDHFPAPLDDKN
tara:strand:+ start:1919 stop:2038 length:120 start_codon:yes stop_codon:yes gene_type:complete